MGEDGRVRARHDARGSSHGKHEALTRRTHCGGFNRLPGEPRADFTCSGLRARRDDAPRVPRPASIRINYILLPYIRRGCFRTLCAARSLFLKARPGQCGSAIRGRASANQECASRAPVEGPQHGQPSKLLRARSWAVVTYAGGEGGAYHTPVEAPSRNSESDCHRRWQLAAVRPGRIRWPATAGARGAQAVAIPSPLSRPSPRWRRSPVSSAATLRAGAPCARGGQQAAEEARARVR